MSGYRRERKARTQGISRPRGTFVHAGIATAVKKDLAADGARRGADRLLKCLEPHEERTAALKQETAERAKGGTNRLGGRRVCREPGR